MQLPRFTTWKTGSIDAAMLNEICEVVERIRLELPELNNRSRASIIDHVEFDAICGSAQLVPGFTNIWDYDWQDAIEDEDRKLIVNESGVHSTTPGMSNARNRCEEKNTAIKSTLGVLLYDPVTNPHPDNPDLIVAVEKIPEGTPIRIVGARNVLGEMKYSFWLPNEYKVECEA